MIWLLRDFDLLSVILRAAALACEAMLLGGAAYLVWVALPSGAEERVLRGCSRWAGWAACGLAATLLLSIAVSATMLVSAGALPFWLAITARPMLAQAGAALAALALAGALRIPQPQGSCAGRGLRRKSRAAALLASVALLGLTVSLSHAASRLDKRALLCAVTALHHVGMAIWLGAMPYLLLSLARTQTAPAARAMVRRFSRMAIAGAAMLIASGGALAWAYVGAPALLYGTSYGLLVVAKAYLTLLILGLGAANWRLQRTLEKAPGPLLLRLRRLGEVEVGLGFTALLAAASLTAQPPAIDGSLDRVSAQEIVRRFRPETPRLHSPALRALAPPTGLSTALRTSQFTGTVAASDANDIAWSEYNHHWAGLVVLAAGALALLSRSPRFRWARFWPASFAGLAAFLLLRADPETWPLGPRPFWASFAEPDVLQHRGYALLILAFAAFECGVQAGRLRARWAAKVFPLGCAIGGALLLTHSHAQASAKDELLIDMSHGAVALLGVTAGWARWLEIRLQPGSRWDRLAGYLWPTALLLIGAVLLDYREA